MCYEKKIRTIVEINPKIGHLAEYKPCNSTAWRSLRTGYLSFVGIFDKKEHFF